MTTNGDQWYNRDGYNSLTQMGVIVEDPHFVIRFKGQCYGTESWYADRTVDALSWQAGCSPSTSRQWEYDNAGEIVDIYDRREEHHCWDRPLGTWLDYLKVDSFDQACRMARHRLSVKSCSGEEALIVGVEGGSKDSWICFFILQDGEYHTALSTSLIPDPEDLKSMKGKNHEHQD